MTKKSKNEAKDKNIAVSSPLLRLSVRDFVSFVYRHGGLKYENYDNEYDGSAINAHQSFYKFYKESDKNNIIYTEYQLQTTHHCSPLSLQIQGRADLIVQFTSGDIQIIEIKTVYNATGSFPESADVLHVAQAKIYAYLFCLEKDIKTSTISICVKYLLIDTFETKDFIQSNTYKELESFFLETCSKYLILGESINRYEVLRKESIKNLTFPFENLRQGQKDFMVALLGSIKKIEPVLLQAPTGTGKTISALYPAIKAIPMEYTDYIFYLTAKTSTQNIAKNTLDILRKNNLIIKSIQITAKEKICLSKEIYCDYLNCPYAVNYYDHYSDAIKELSQIYSIDAQVLQQVGEKYKACPFELGLDISLFCDIILCDYNYMFDPRVKLERFVDQKSYKFAVLVDEAHNLPDRANEMFSASSSRKEFEEVLKNKSHFSVSLNKSILDVITYLNCVDNYFNEDNEADNSFDSSIQPKDLVISSLSCASRKTPNEYIDLLENFVIYAKEFIDKSKVFTIKKPLLNLFFSAKFFLKIAGEFFNDSYITIFSKQNHDILITLKCLDSSEQLHSFYKESHAIAFFSATLSPITYFENRLKSVKSDYNLNKIILPSPFPKENLFVGIVNSVSTKYYDRSNSLSLVADIIEAATSCKVGNYMIYSPSFEYQNLIIGAFENLLKKNDKNDSVIIIKQTQFMSEKNRTVFLDYFAKFGEKTLIAFAVLGGIFGEGIDLIGEALSGAIIVGVGLPKRTFERDIIMQYYSATLGNGYNFAYRFPGFNKILQAAGRVIRSENDKGFILLVDERYESTQYQSLFPDEWNPVYLKTPKSVSGEIKAFLDD